MPKSFTAFLHEPAQYHEGRLRFTPRFFFRQARTLIIGNLPLQVIADFVSQFRFQSPLLDEPPKPAHTASPCNFKMAPTASIKRAQFAVSTLSRVWPLAVNR